MLVTSAELGTALRKTEGYLLSAPILEALLARREAGQAFFDDTETTAELAIELTSHQSQEGSWGSQVARTAEALLLLGSLLPTATRLEAALRAVTWLRARQNRPGRFGDPCAPDLHRALVCHHATSGFFSPASPQASLDGYMLQNGVRFSRDRDARLAISALTLRAVLRWSEINEEDRKHIAALARMTESMFRPGRVQLASPVASVIVLETLLAVPRTPELAGQLQMALARLVSMQRGDGSWSELDPIHVADLLLQAIRQGYAVPLFDAALLRMSEQLTFGQKPDGTWTPTVEPYRTLVGWRVLRHVTAQPAR